MKKQTLTVLLYCRGMHLAATSLMKEQEGALEIFLPVGRCLLTLLSKKSRVVSLIRCGCDSNHEAKVPQPTVECTRLHPSLHFSFCPSRNTEK